MMRRKGLAWLALFRVSRRNDRIGMAWIGALSFLFFALTLSGVTGVGQSSWMAAHSLGLLSQVIVTHPLTLAVYRQVALHTVGWQLLAVHIVSALMMAGACAAMFRFCRRLFLREPEDVLALISGMDGPYEEEPTAAQQFWMAKMESHAPIWEQVVATLSAVSAVVAFAVVPPVRLAATQQSTQALTCLLLAVAADRLMMFSLTGRRRCCLVAAALIGAGCVESPAIAVAAPVYAMAALWIAMKGDRLSNSFFLKALLFVAIGILAEAVLFALGSVWTRGGVPITFRRLCGEAIRSYWTETQEMFPRRYWVYAALPGGVLLPVSWMAVKRFHDVISRHLLSLAVWGVLVLVNSVAAAACVLGMKFTPWNVLRATGSLPAESALGVALAFGLSVAFWGLVGVGLRRPMASDGTEQGSDMEQPCPFWARFPARALFVALGVLIFVALGRQWNEGNIRNAAFLDRTADCLLGNAGDAKVVICDDLMFLHTSVRNSLKGGKVRVLEGGPFPALAAKDPLPPFPALSKDGKSLPAREAWSSWLHHSPTTHKMLVDQRSQDLWQQTGFISVPFGLAYAGSTEPPNPAELREKGDECWKYFNDNIRQTAIQWPFLKNKYDLACAYISRMANDLGVTLALLGDSEGADKAFQAALSIHQHNICAALNSFALRTLAPSLGSPMPLYYRICACILLWGQTPTPYVIERTFYQNGKLMEQQPDVLMPAVFRVIGSPRNQSLAQRYIFQLWMKIAGGRPRSAPVKTMADYANPGASMVEKYNLVLSLEAAGQMAFAEKVLNSLVETNKRDLIAWSMLADLLIAKGDFERIAVTVLPAMRVADKMTPSPINDAFTQRIEGLYLLRRPNSDPVGARKFLVSVLTVMPEDAEVASNLLAADMIISDRAQTEGDILHVLKLQPNHALANGLLGSLRMKEGKMDEAEALLKKSLSISDSGSVENELSELYHRKGDMQKAEEHIRHAIRIDPLRPLVWDTLGSLLIEQGRLEEAREVLVLGQSLDPNDARILRSLERLNQITPNQ